MRRVKLWRNDGRPEARLAGVQYRANDDGRRQGPFTVVAAEAAPWLFDKTGLANGSTFGETVGGYGIEIDMTTPDSPPGTTVLARDHRSLRPGPERRDDVLRERRRRTRLLGGRRSTSAARPTFWPITRMLENLWQHMLADVVPPPAPVGRVRR